jgi:quercetin dioxygenase-like cupin family protein
VAVVMLGLLRVYRGSRSLLAMIVLGNLANITLFSSAIVGPEKYLAGYPLIVVTLVAAQIVATAALIGVLATRTAPDFAIVRGGATTTLTSHERPGNGRLLAIQFQSPDVRGQAIANASLTRRPLLAATIEGSKTVAQVQSAQIDLLPAQATGIHRHPVPVVGLVTRGVFQFQVDGESSRRLTAGSAFYEPANTRILQFDNASDREPASIVAFYLMGRDDRESITLAK